MLASRTLARCDKLKAEIQELGGRAIDTAQVDADDVPRLTALLARVPAPARHQRRPALPGPPHHGRLPRRRRPLPRHRQLRAARRRQVRVQVAVGVPGPVPGRRPDGAARLGLRPRHDQRLLRPRPEAPVRRDPLRRHRRLQRRRPRQGVRDQLQPRDQHPRDHRARPLLGGRRVEGDRPAQRVAGVRLPRGRREEELPALSRGARVAVEEPARAAPHPLLDDLRRGLPQAPRGPRERRHDPDRSGHGRRPPGGPDQAAQGAAPRPGVAGRRLHRQDLDRVPDRGRQGRQAQALPDLQRVRPRRDLQGGARPGGVVHDRRPGDDRRGDDGDRRVERRGCLQHGSSSTPIRSSPTSRPAACPGTSRSDERGRRRRRGGDR